MTAITVIYQPEKYRGTCPNCYSIVECGLDALYKGHIHRCPVCMSCTGIPVHPIPPPERG